MMSSRSVASRTHVELCNLIARQVSCSLEETMKFLERSADNVSVREHVVKGNADSGCREVRHRLSCIEFDLEGDDKPSPIGGDNDLVERDGLSLHLAFVEDMTQPVYSLQGAPR